MTVGRVIRVVLPALATVFVLVGPAQASGFGLSWLGCIQNTGAGTSCASTGGTAPGLGQAHQVAVSPDGANVYVASAVPGAVAVFSRGTGGKLTPRGCIENTGGTDCGATHTTPGLAGARGVAVSPDGANVYVASDVRGAVVMFSRGTGGALTPQGCIENTGATDCGTTHTTPGLAGARGVTVSPDGKNLYVAAYGMASTAENAASPAGAVVAFSRALGGGLTPLGCVQNTGASGCGASTAGLAGARGVVVSSNGSNVYVAARHSSAVAVFSRGVGGALTSRGCIQNTGGTACGGAVAPGLAGAYQLAISPDGANVYLTALDGSDVAEFSRASTGGLTWRGCIQNTGGTTCTASGGTAPGLQSPFGVTVSPGGQSVYVASLGSGAVAEFSRGTGGLLSSRGCIQLAGRTACAASGGTAPALASVTSVAVSPDSANVYATAQYSHAIAEFKRALP